MDTEFLHQKELVLKHKIFEYHGIVNEEKHRNDIENIDLVVKPHLVGWSIGRLIYYCYRYGIPNTNFTVTIALANNEIMLYLDCLFNSEKKQELHGIIIPVVRTKEELKKMYIDILTNGKLQGKSSHFLGDLKHSIEKEVNHKLINFEKIDEQTFLCSLIVSYLVNKNSDENQ